MNRLHTELHRLYLPPAVAAAAVDGGSASGDSPAGADLVDADGQVRAMVLELARPADWATLSAVWAGVQADLHLPAPAIAASGLDGIQLWFSLAQAVPVAQAAPKPEPVDEAAALARRDYLRDLEGGRLAVKRGLVDETLALTRLMNAYPHFAKALTVQDLSANA